LRRPLTKEGRRPSSKENRVWSYIEIKKATFWSVEYMTTPHASALRVENQVYMTENIAGGGQIGKESSVLKS